MSEWRRKRREQKILGGDIAAERKELASLVLEDSDETIVIVKKGDELVVDSVKGDIHRITGMLEVSKFILLNESVQEDD
ncbi:hypothetical protein M3689_01020 [Alkalihalophilus marmarensis]|jgi:hypothetical protein|uniref:hypothetical protein n=1 Tax=Alkalihalophilus marmarensis TaxID=521377 RepID=UPI0020410458|nr:hypothetical protein [Alkalihalophilus marmarensis]MCM3487881.1 hypothetical protein [Alkalihalophilus marmarensis]